MAKAKMSVCTEIRSRGEVIVTLKTVTSRGPLHVRINTSKLVALMDRQTRKGTFHYFTMGILARRMPYEGGAHD
jgi:hypothetical protein